MFCGNVIDKDIPVPVKMPTRECGSTKVVADKSARVRDVLRSMEVGDSVLLSNWAQNSIWFVQKCTCFKFTSRLQPDGNVRVWRIK